MNNKMVSNSRNIFLFLYIYIVKPGTLFPYMSVYKPKVHLQLRVKKSIDMHLYRLSKCYMCRAEASVNPSSLPQML